MSVSSQIPFVTVQTNELKPGLRLSTVAFEVDSSVISPAPFNNVQTPEPLTGGTVTIKSELVVQIFLSFSTIASSGALFQTSIVSFAVHSPFVTVQIN